MAGMRAFKVAKCPEAHAKTNRAVVNQKECFVKDCVGTSVTNVNGTGNNWASSRLTKVLLAFRSKYV